MKQLACILMLVLLAVSCSNASDDAAEVSASPEAPINTEVFTVLDEIAFRQLLPADAEITKLAGDMQFVEGPVLIGADGGYLVFSDVRANELKRWDPNGGLQTFRAPSGMTNGNTLDLQGRLVSAQHDGRVTRTEEDGTVVTLVDKYLDRSLSSPNDLVVKSDGTIWFTDPPFGLEDREQETPGNYVYRLDPESSELTAVVTDIERPNGLCFSPDEATLYVADTERERRHIRSFTVAADGSLTSDGVFATIDERWPDGIRCDEMGNVWSSSGDGVQIFSPSGELAVRILLPESARNLAFGGSDGTTVYVTAGASLYMVPSLVHDAKGR